MEVEDTNAHKNDVSTFGIKQLNCNNKRERTNEIMKNVVAEGIVLPTGMNGFHRKVHKFIRWLPDHSGPIIYENDNIPDAGFDEIDVRLKWNKEGYFMMRRKDSAAFNAVNNPTLTIERDKGLNKRKIDALDDNANDKDKKQRHRQLSKCSESPVATGSTIERSGVCTEVNDQAADFVLKDHGSNEEVDADTVGGASSGEGEAEAENHHSGSNSANKGTTKARKSVHWLPAMASNITNKALIYSSQF